MRIAESGIRSRHDIERMGRAGANGFLIGEALMRSKEPAATFRSCSMVKIKVCGMTNLDDCLKAQELGIDFVGFVFYRHSERYVIPHDVRKI